jgi:thiamine-phosphate pyrophosphorylase
VIVDTEVVKRQRIPHIVLSCIKGGADIVQLRDKAGSTHQTLNTIYKITQLFSGTRIPLIINDRIDILLATGADGVHLGEDDMPVALARKIVGRKKIIGFSADTLKKAETALKEGADYLGVGPAFSTSTKPGEKPINWDVYRELNRYIKAPYFAIGGITPKNVEGLFKMGVKRVCVTRAICVSDNPKKATIKMKNMVNAV